MNKSGAHIINKWLWSYLSDTDDFSGDYGGIVPIIPSSQQPELVNIPTGLPFITYAYKTGSNYDSYWIHNETEALMVYDSNEARLRSIRETILDLAGRLDDSARDVNGFNADEYGINFEFINAQATDVNPPDQEAGRMSCMIILRYSFTRQLDNPFQHS